MSKQEFRDRFGHAIMSYNKRPEHSRGEMAAQAELTDAGLLHGSLTSHLNERLVTILVDDGQNPEKRDDHVQTAWNYYLSYGHTGI